MLPDAGTPQCERCRGAGYLRAHLLATPQQIYAAAKMPEFAKSPVPVQKDICPNCNGSGRIFPNSSNPHPFTKEP